MHPPDPMRRRCLAAVLAACSTRVFGASPRAQASDTRLRALLEAERQPGIAAVLVERGVVVAQACAGFRDDARRHPVTVDTVFELGSVTKVFTAVLAFHLRDAGRLDIDAPIGRYVDRLPVAWRGIPLRRLLSHTSGIPNYLDARNFIGLLPTQPAPRALLDIVADRPLEFAPGTAHAYSNTNYVLAGLAIERAAGTDYWTHLADTLLRPLRMTDAGPRIPRDPRPIAQGHLLLGERWIRPPVTAAGAAWSAGALLASPRDMARFAIALQTGLVLPDATLRDMWADTPLLDGRGAGWSAGWEVLDAQRGLVGHGGGTAGFTAFLRHDPTRQRSVVVLVSRAGEIDPKAIAERVDLALDDG